MQSRRLKWRIVALSAFVLAACTLAACGGGDDGEAAEPGESAGGTLNVLTWEGYADPSFVDAFTTATGCTVSATYVGSNDDFAPKLAAGGDVFDLITPSIDTTSIMIEAGFVEPIDTERIEGYTDTYEQFRTAPGVNADGKVYGIPFTWGSIPFMYRTDKFEEPPTSLAALWDEQYKGKISLWDDKSSLYVAARYLGYDNIYSLDDEQLAEAAAALEEQKPLIRKYWATAGELVDLFSADEVWISNTWGGFQSSQLEELGIPVAEFIPEEGAEGWSDYWMLVKGSSNIDCAYEWLNFAVSPDGQCGVSTVTGYSASNPVAVKDCMSEEEYIAKHQDDPDYIKQLILWETPERLDKMNEVWNGVKTG